MNSSNIIKRAFYPCCAADILGPLQIMNGMVDEVIFCDKRFPTHRREREKIIYEAGQDGLPRPIFEPKDVERLVPHLPDIHIYFYRRDTAQGEGGSNLYLLGEKWLTKILEKFPDKGGLIITDGSNCDDNWSKICSAEGFTWEKIGWKFKKKLNPKIGALLSVIQVERVNNIKI